MKWRRRVTATKGRRFMNRSTSGMLSIGACDCCRMSVSSLVYNEILLLSSNLSKWQPFPFFDVSLIVFWSRDMLRNGKLLELIFAFRWGESENGNWDSHKMNLQDLQYLHFSLYCASICLTLWAHLVGINYLVRPLNHFYCLFKIYLFSSSERRWNNRSHGPVSWRNEELETVFNIINP